MTISAKSDGRALADNETSNTTMMDAFLEMMSHSTRQYAAQLQY
jgi:hypothetical protein